MHGLSTEGYAAQHREDEPADRIHIVVIGPPQRNAGFRFQILYFRPRIGDEPSRLFLDQRRLIGVMFVLDVADDFLQKVFDGNQTVRAAMFVNDQRHMDMTVLHPHQQIERRHGWRSKNQLAQDPDIGERLRKVRRAQVQAIVSRVRLALLKKPYHQIFDVNHADGLIERLGREGVSRAWLLSEAYLRASDTWELHGDADERTLVERENDFVARQVLALDPINPQIAARLLGAFRSWRTLEPGRRAKARSALSKIVQSPNLSRDVYEIATKIAEA